MHKLFESAWKTKGIQAVTEITLKNVFKRSTSIKYNSRKALSFTFQCKRAVGPLQMH